LDNEVANHAQRKVVWDADLLHKEVLRFRDGGVTIIPWEEDSVADGLAKVGVERIKDVLWG